jgi:hypothetical protein
MFSSIAADGCEIADFKCHCSSGAKIRPQLAPCIAKACSSSDEDGKMLSPHFPYQAEANLAPLLIAPGNLTRNR